MRENKRILKFVVDYTCGLKMFLHLDEWWEMLERKVFLYHNI